MATLAISFAINTHAGAQMRALAKAIEKAAAAVPDNVSSGAATVLTVDNAPSSGTVSVAVSGPYAGSTFIV